jgi:hypothetical protein
MAELTKADQRFCELADDWRQVSNWVTYSCQHREFRTGGQTHFRVLASNLLDESRRRRSDLDLNALATLWYLNFENPPDTGELELLVRDATDLVVETLTEITTGKRGAHIDLSRPSLKLMNGNKPPGPLEITLKLLSGSEVSIRLVEYLFKDAMHQQAHLDQIAIDLDNAPKSRAFTRRKTIRMRYDRAKRLLDEKDAPLRLTIENNVVSIIPASHATQM